jgi:hypothetical protein
MFDSYCAAVFFHHHNFQPKEFTVRTSLDDLMEARPVFEKFPEQKIVATGMPLRHYAQEAVMAYHRFVKDKDALITGGMDFSIVEKLEVNIGASRQLASEASTTTLPSSSKQKEWEIAKEEAELLAYDIKEATLYAFRSRVDLTAKIHFIYNEGGSNADQIQDLNDLAVIGKANRELMEAVGYDMANFDRAAELSKIMAELLALATLDKSTSPALRILRDKAFTVVKTTIDELNLLARFVFRSDKAKAATFAINPPRKKPAKKSAEEKETVVAS